MEPPALRACRALPLAWALTLGGSRPGQAVDPGGEARVLAAAALGCREPRTHKNNVPAAGSAEPRASCPAPVRRDAGLHGRVGGTTARS